MKQKTGKARTPRAVLASALVLLFLSFVSCATAPQTAYQKEEMKAAVMGPPAPRQVSAPLPLLERGEPADWWFVFKFNGATFQGCGDNAERS